MGDFPRHPTMKPFPRWLPAEVQDAQRRYGLPTEPQKKDVSRGKTMKDMKESYQFGWSWISFRMLLVKLLGSVQFPGFSTDRRCPLWALCTTATRGRLFCGVPTSPEGWGGVAAGSNYPVLLLVVALSESNADQSLRHFVLVWVYPNIRYIPSLQFWWESIFRQIHFVLELRFSCSKFSNPQCITG